MVNGIISLLFTLLGVVAFIWTVWVFSPEAFAGYPVLDWLIRLLSIVLVVVFLYPDGATT